MAPFRECVLPYVQNFLTSTLHSLLGGIDSNFQGLRTTAAYFCGKNEWLRFPTSLTVVSSRTTGVVYGCLAYTLSYLAVAY